ncbi:hypothetical protein L1987_44697 [Smallanthus sonchifolius]|uniref:Uncharacterized protein n=1 Tax=Smallanthus sonchifolius TaxID=185202 RepID=A0ACB9GR74_9ASTR|nr:hypothetical protein L1987_44697 [Smallanthus sonchifolius]
MMAAEKELLCNLRCTIDQALLYDQAIDHDFQVEVIVTAGGIEEYIIKCLAYRGDFSLSCANLHSKGLNCVGSMLVPNKDYCYEAPKLRLDLGERVVNFVKIYHGVVHGWTVRHKDDDEHVVKCAMEAHTDMLNWFTKYLK